MVLNVQSQHSIAGGGLLIDVPENDFVSKLLNWRVEKLIVHREL
jgi:hypothetical protein